MLLPPWECKGNGQEKVLQLTSNLSLCSWATNKRSVFDQQGHNHSYWCSWVMVTMHTPTRPATSISGLCSHLNIGRCIRINTIHHMLACHQLQIPQSMKPGGTIISVVVTIHRNITNGAECVCVCTTHTSCMHVNSFRLLSWPLAFISHTAP